MAKRGICVIAAVLLGLAAATLLGLTGCAHPEFLNLSVFQSSGDKGKERVFSGSLETVSQSAESVLLNLGMTVVSTPAQEGVRIKATTRKGGTFFLVLTRQPGKDGKPETTRARIEWAGGPEEPVAIEIMAGLEALGRK